jgi:hypothetical protein
VPEHHVNVDVERASRALIACKPLQHLLRLEIEAVGAVPACHRHEHLVAPPRDTRSRS